MGFSLAVSTAFRRYATFSGRSRRAEFWWWTLFVTLMSLVAAVLDLAIGADVSGGTGPLQLLVTLALIVPNIAVTVRRLHDTGKSGWRFLWTLVPLVGVILLVVWCVEDSDPGPNLFGASPKQAWPSTW